MRHSEIDMASEATLHEMRQELLAADEMHGLDIAGENRLREIEGALQRKGAGVGVA